MAARRTVAPDSHAGQPRQASTPASTKAIERLLEAKLPEGSSGTLVAALDGEMVVCRGWGLADREAKVPADCDTAYDIMSMTKQFTAAAILKLQMQGKAGGHRPDQHVRRRGSPPTSARSRCSSC